MKSTVVVGQPKKKSKKKSKKKIKKTSLGGKIECSACGTLKGISKDRIVKLIGQFGSIDLIREKYICRDCRKILNVRKDGRIKPIKKKRKNKPDAETLKTQVRLWNWTPTGPKTPTPEELASANVCYRPDIWFGNGKGCNGCHLFENSCGDLSRRLLDLKKLKKNHLKRGYDKMPLQLAILTRDM